MSSYPTTGKSVVGRRLCWIPRQQMEGKHLSFQREKHQESREHIAFHKKKKSEFTAYVYTNIYFQGCTESNIIREKNKKDWV